MSESQLERYRRQLLELGRRIQRNASGLAGEAMQGSGGEASGNLSNAPLHMADLGTDQFSRDLAVSFLETENQALAAIAAALGRIDAGTFGHCEDCRRPISAERLAAVPYAARCIDCARTAERDQAGQTLAQP